MFTRAARLRDAELQSFRARVVELERELRTVRHELAALEDENARLLAACDEARELIASAMASIGGEP